MKTFTLSWIEFLEYQRESIRGPSNAAILALVLPPIVAATTFSALVGPVMHSENEVSAIGLCVLSILLFTAAFRNLQWRGQKSWDAREARARYEHYYSGERSFEFDAKEFVLQTESGTQRMLWANLSNASEYRSTIMLEAKGQLTVIIPKRALNREELDDLRQIILNPTQTWRSRLGLLDYLLTDVALRWRSHSVLTAAGHLAAIFCFIVLAHGLYSTTGAQPFAKWIFLGLFLFLTTTAEFWDSLIMYLALGSARGPWEVGISSNGMHFKTADSNSFYAWSCFEKAEELMRCFLLYWKNNTNAYYLLPERCVPVELKSAVKKTLQVKLCHTANRLQDAE